MMQVTKAVVCGAMLVMFGACASTRHQAPAASSGTEAAAPATPQAAPEKAKDEPAGELNNTLKWTTASEVENFGFDIYRSTSEDGPFERMTAEPLAGAGTVDEPQDYVWVDSTIEPGVDYYYYIESISMAGVRERFSPIIKSPAKY